MNKFRIVLFVAFTAFTAFTSTYASVSNVCPPIQNESSFDRLVEDFNKIAEAAYRQDCINSYLSLGDIADYQIQKNKKNDAKISLVNRLNKMMPNEMIHLCKGLVPCNLFIRFRPEKIAEVQAELRNIAKMKGGKKIDDAIVKLFQSILRVDQNGTIMLVASSRKTTADICEQLDERERPSMCFVNLGETRAYQFHVGTQLGEDFHLGRIYKQVPSSEEKPVRSPPINTQVVSKPRATVWLYCAESDCDKEAACGYIRTKYCYKTSKKKYIRTKEETGYPGADVLAHNSKISTKVAGGWGIAFNDPYTCSCWTEDQIALIKQLK